MVPAARDRRHRHRRAAPGATLPVGLGAARGAAPGRAGLGPDPAAARRALLAVRHHGGAGRQAVGRALPVLRRLPDRSVESPSAQPDRLRREAGPARRSDPGRPGSPRPALPGRIRCVRPPDRAEPHRRADAGRLPGDARSARSSRAGCPAWSAPTPTRRTAGSRCSTGCATGAVRAGPARGTPSPPTATARGPGSSCRRRPGGRSPRRRARRGPSRGTGATPSAPA